MKKPNMEQMKKLSRKQFYLLSFTWGLPMSLVGVIVCLVLMMFGFKPKRYGHCYYIAIGNGWGGLELGWLFLVSKTSGEYTYKHELGHGYQNACMFGWIMPIFSIISACRYWARRFGAKIDYYKWFFESQANEIGAYIMEGSEDET